MSTNIEVNMWYDTPHSVPPSDYIQQQTIFLSLNFRFNNKYETALTDVNGRQIVVTLNPECHISPCFSCPIHPRLMATDQDPSSLCNYLLNFLNSCIPDVNNTSRLYVAQTIADSLKTTPVFPSCQVRANVEIVQHESSWIHHHLHHQHDGDVGESRAVEGGETGASKLALHELMEKGSFNYGGGAGERQECSICWDNYREEIEAIKMPECLHVFHKKCIF